MKRPSFRLRIALLSAALAGSALVGFSAVSWFQIYKAKLGGLDAKLVNQLSRIAGPPDRKPRSQERWKIYQESLTYALGPDTTTGIALLVLDTNSDILYQANSSPADLDINRLLAQNLQLAPPLPTFKPPERSRLPHPPLPLAPKLSERSRLPPPPPPQLTTVKTATAAWRVGVAKFPHVQVAIAISLQAIDREMAIVSNIFFISIPGALLSIAYGAWLVSGSALQPIRQLTQIVQQVTVKGLNRRIPLGTTDVEFIELISVFNQMLERLERSFTQASRFSADAAHELKTPLTIMQGELERTLQQASPGSEVQQRLSNLLDEVRRLSGIMRKLLLLSLADAGQMSLYKVEVDMSKLLALMVEDVELLAPHLSVETNIDRDLKIQGDRDLLNQVLQNLFSNAIKYNLADGWIKVYAKQTQVNIKITIVNASKDIPLTDKERIFERFHRGDPARTRKVEGIGLGLSLAREIARSHQGDLMLDSSSSGQTAFTLTLPIS